MSTEYSIGQMNQLGDALETAGFSPDDVTKLRAYPQLAAFRDVLHGLAEIRPPEHIIDCDADPFVLEGWQVEEHKKGGQWKWNPSQISLFLSDRQKTGWVKGHDLRQELKGQKVLNANVLDFLLKHPELIPEEWKGKFTFFWGTIYRDPYGDPYVRYLRWRGEWWRWSSYWLEGAWRAADPAAVSASI